MAVSNWSWHLELSRVTPEHGVHDEYGSGGVQGSAGKGSALAERRGAGVVDAQPDGERFDTS